MTFTIGLVLPGSTWVAGMSLGSRVTSNEDASASKFGALHLATDPYNEFTQHLPRSCALHDLESRVRLTVANRLRIRALIPRGPERRRRKGFWWSKAGFSNSKCLGCDPAPGQSTSAVRSSRESLTTIWSPIRRCAQHTAWTHRWREDPRLMGNWAFLDGLDDQLVDGRIPLFSSDLTSSIRCQPA